MSTHDDDFWGNQSEWPTQSLPKVTRRSDADRSGPIDIVRRGWNQMLGSGANATREHGIVRPGMARPDDRTPVAPVRHDLFDDLDDDLGWDVAPRRTPARAVDPVAPHAAPVVAAVDDRDDDLDDVLVIDGWDAEFVPVDERRRRPAAAVAGAGAARRSHGGGHVGQVGIDPLIARVGALAVVTVLLIPVVLGFLSGGDDTDLLETATLAAAQPTTTAPLIVVPPAESPAPAAAPAPSAPATTPVTAAPVAQPQASTASAPAPTSAAPAESPTSTSTAVASAPSLSSTGANTPAAADEPASRVERPCPIEYEVVAGDFWIRLADGAGVPLADLLSTNGATVNTPLFPGATICLPAGSTIPPPPATTPPTTQAPTTTAPPTTRPPATTPPTTPPTTRPPTTQAPTTTAPPSTRVPTTGEVQQIIRNVWPDDLEDRAIEIAFRESRFVPTAKNFCCYGIFQIYWTVHRGWLADLGITSSQQLFDPETNARAAYALYQRAGGWGPWGF